MFLAMCLSDEQFAKLFEMIHFAFIDIRMLASMGKAEQAADLADAFHNLPREIRKDSVILEKFRDWYLKPYFDKYPQGAAYNYIALVNNILAMSNTDFLGN